MNDRVARLLDGSRPAGVYRLESRAAATSIASQAEAQGWRAFYLDGDEIASKGEFLQACARAMNFPTYFGNNWDALEDSLRDMSWTAAQGGYLILYDNAGRFATAQPKEFVVAVDILRNASSFWSGTPTPMAVLLRGAGRAGAKIPQL